MAIQLTPRNIHRAFQTTIDTMQKNLNRYVVHPNRDFTRNRVLPFKDVVMMILGMQGSTLNGEIDNFYTNRHPKKPLASRPAASTFIRQRSKLNEDFFPELLKSFNRAFPCTKTRFGMHLIACDGMDLNIAAADDSSTFISYNSKKGGYHQFHVTANYDILENRYLDAVIQPRAQVNENDACVTLVNRNPLSGSCLFIADRGFDAFNTMIAISQKKQFFLFRLKDPDSKMSPFRDLIRPDEDEYEVESERFFSRSLKPLRDFPPAQCRRLSPCRRFDFIPQEDKESVFRFRFRFICIKLDNGSHEYLITNVPKSRCKLSDFKDLYHLRWSIETSFLFLKYHICLASTHSIRRDFLRQEIFARLIMYNYCALITASVGTPKATKRYDRRVSFSDAIRIARRHLLAITPFADGDITAAILKHVYPVRTDKNRPRNMRSQRLVSFQTRA